MRFGGKIMCKAAEVGKIVVNKCLDLGYEINTQKLQKLLVLMQVECIKETGRPLFTEDIRVWNCGVAIKEVDEEFALFAKGFNDRLIENIILLEKENACVNSIISKYGTKDAFELNELEINQKVIDLGAKSEKDMVPHINYQILIGVFSKYDSN